MKSFKSTAKLALAVVVLMVTSGCYTTKMGTDYDFQGKVWRGDITRQFVKDSDPSLYTAEFIEESHVDPITQKSPRVVLARIFDGGFFKDLHVGGVTVPDNVEFADLGKGAIVDVIFQKGTDVDFRVANVNRIIRLVCAGTDKACIRRERSAGRVNTIIDPTPAAGFLNGNTYKRQVSAEERAKYE